MKKIIALALVLLVVGFSTTALAAPRSETGKWQNSGNTVVQNDGVCPYNGVCPNGETCTNAGGQGACLNDGVCPNGGLRPMDGTGFRGCRQ